ncbi:hypothetical protein M3Y97_00699800 [Aphelenchoides bicaudatus]|nr:hypothetical protein M3Y97_00699800 [Aphelenchoides bicaudatus]
MFTWKFLYIFAWFACLARAKKLPDIYWNSTNQIFDISNTDHVKQVRLLDRVTIICPRPTTAENYEWSKLFIVRREEYDSCELYAGRLLGICATPDRQSSISLVFRDVSPIPSAFEFYPGHSYYVIATSNGTHSGLNNTFGGLCLLNNMRLKFDVLKNEESIEQTTPVNTFTASKSRLFGDGQTKSVNAVDLNQKKSPTPSTVLEQNQAEPITYIIHTVEPEHYTVAHSLLGGNSPDSAYSLSVNLHLFFGCMLALFLLDLGWRRF